VQDDERLLGQYIVVDVRIVLDRGYLTANILAPPQEAVHPAKIPNVAVSDGVVRLAIVPYSRCREIPFRPAKVDVFK
jgi:hemolysin activation/secretion protein